MKLAHAIAAWLLLAGLWSATESGILFGQTNMSVEQSLAAGQAALRQKHYAEAIRVLEDASSRFPRDRRLRVELGRAYLYDHQDDRAIKLFQEVLREDPSNRPAKLELARALGYHRDYNASNQLYRELLKANADDEAAWVGLVRNLIHQKQTAEARRELDRALARHPNSLLLQKFKDRLEKRPAGGGEGVRPPNRMRGGVDYFSDSAGNRSARAQERFDYQITRRLSNRLLLDERSLWRSSGPKANVFSAIDELRVRPRPWLLLGAGGGAVRFFDGTSRGLYRGTLELHPERHLWLDGTFSRVPINPTFRAAGFKLLAEGWQTRLDWRPGAWRLSANLSRQHYSDGNRRQMEAAELLRWLGSPRVAVGTGYSVRHFTFSQHFIHGYFNPREYVSHMGLGGVRFRLGKAFRGEYLAGVGAESFSPGALTSLGPYRLAWEVALRNRAAVGNWDVGGDYYYWHFAQVTGAFRAQGGSLVIGYRF
jgi:tetratricopeptide (TPR) repeat protein